MGGPGKFDCLWAFRPPFFMMGGGRRVLKRRERREALRRSGKVRKIIGEGQRRQHVRLTKY